MDFSLFYFAADGAVSNRDRYRLLLDGARFADRAGLTAVWVPERHFHPFGGLYPNPSVTGAALAVATERIQIRAGSVVAPLHHPLRIAEEWSVVDNLSGGRVGLAFASGWHAVDFAFAPETYGDRRAVMAERIDQVRRAWRGEELPVRDGLGTEQKVRVYPPPVRAELPIWLTSGGSVETFRAAGRLGAGVLTNLEGQGIDELAHKIAEYRRASTGPGHVVLMVHTCVGTDDRAVRELVRRPLRDYMRHSFDLILRSKADGGNAMDSAALDPADIDAVVDRAFDRYFDESALLGAPPKVLDHVRRFAAIGVDELACLIDFGVPTEVALDGLERLAGIRDAVA